MKISILILLTLHLCQSVRGQHQSVIGDKVKSITLVDTIASVHIDRPGKEVEKFQ